MKYRREIDGLRALAVLPVILFHANFEIFSGGFVGVDVFFVISGYLITTIISTELDQGKFSIVKFYERRARRILPALFLVMLVSIPLSLFWLMPSDMKDFSQSLVAVSVFASNILFWQESGYFGTASEVKPLLHTWSLAVEEQYYVLFPLFLMITWRLGKRSVVGLLSFVAILSLATAQWGSTADPNATFFLLPTRGWELLIGAFVAFYLQGEKKWKPSRMLRELCGLVGLSMLFYSVFAYSKQTPFPSLYTLVPTVGTALIILCATQHTIIGRFLGNKLFVGVGLTSYSAYLWHQPLFAFARHISLTEPSHAVFILLSVLAIVLSYFSWKYFEVFFRNKDLVHRKAIFICSLVGSLFFITIGFSGIFLQDYITYFRFNETQIAAISSASPSPKRRSCHFPDVEDSLIRSPCRYFSDNVKVAVFGNSHATELAYSLASSLKSKNIGVVQHTISRCNHNYNIEDEKDSVCGRWHKKVVGDLISDQAVEFVILSYRNEEILSSPRHRKALADLANDLSDAGKKVVLVLQVPMPLYHINRYLRSNINSLSGSIPSRKLSEWEDLYSEHREILGLLKPDIEVIDPIELFCDSDYCYVTKQGVSLFFDDNHMSVAGGKLIADILVKSILRFP